MTTAAELSKDDLKMSEWSDRLQHEVGVSGEASATLATSIYRDIRTLPINLSSVSDVIPYAERFNELALFLNWNAESQDYVKKESSCLSRARLVLSNYMCFVYLGEICFVRLRKQLPKKTTAGRCCRYLTENPVRAFRNAVAHGNWRIRDGIVQPWARKGDSKEEPPGQFQVSDADRTFWFFLAACTGKSALAALAESLPGTVQ